MSEARLWLEEQEENRLKSENIQRPDTKWVFEANLMIEVKIIEDLQAALHVGAGRLPDWLRNKRSLLALDKYTDVLCIFICIAVHQGANRVRNKRKTRKLAASFFDKHRVRGWTYKGHFSLIQNHFQQGIAGYEIDAEGALALKYLPSRFDKIRVPQIDIGIYEEHALLITKPDKVTKHYACAECQARFTKACHLQRHAEACTRRVSMVVCRGEGNQPLETAYEKAFYGHRAYAGKAVSWMEHEAQRRGVHIHHQMCVQGGERTSRISSGWFLLGNKRGVSVPWLPLAWLSRVFSRTAQGSGRFRKNKARQERAYTREGVCKNVG